MAFRQQTNGYLNGASDNRLRRPDYDSSRENSADERSRSRPGGYFGAASAQQADQVHGVARLDRGYAQRRSGEYNRRSKDYGSDGYSRSRSRPGYGGSGATGGRYGAAGRQGEQVEEILRYIEQHWSFMSSGNCTPVKVALQLMDPSSLGLQDQSAQFAEAHTQLQNALKVIVNEHHQGFNSSIGTFHKIQTSIRESQHRVRQLRAGLVSAQKNLSTNRPELKALAQSSQDYDAMLHTISTIETLQSVPDRLEAQIREKRYLGAVDNLLEALATIRKPELEDIGALSELRVHLSNQEQILTDMLVEELHNHLYLKSPYCEERWKAKTSKERTTEDSSTNSAANRNLDAADMAMYRFLDTYDGAAAMQEDATRNPEADTFYYIQLLIESLNKMSKLDVAADRIEERLPVELFKVLERTLGEVDSRHPQSLMGSGARSRGQQGVLMNTGNIGGIDAEQKSTLEDLLATLYGKFEAIAEGHRVLHDVTAAILKRDSVPASEAGPLNRSFRELWKLLQSEIRNLLHDHLATDGNMGLKSRQQNHASANIFRPQPRDKSRKLFKLSDALREKKNIPGSGSKSTTTNNAMDLNTEREDLEFILKSSVPGLVNSNMLEKDGLDHDASEGADRSATGHKLLVAPSIFNMGILLPPSLSFLRHLRDIVPPHSTVAPSTLTAFLDDFLINVFYPQLDETLLDLCGRCLSDLDTFQPDPNWSSFASKPIFKGIKRFLDVMEGVCSLLAVLPHEQSFAQLVVGQMRGVYDRCYEWSKSLLQRVQMSNSNGHDPNQAGANESVKMRLAADLATEGEINDIVIELLRLSKEGGEEETDDIQKEKLVCAEKESELLIRFIKNRELEDSDLINDRKALAALCALHVSMKWLAARCASLRFISPRAVDTANTQVGAETTRKRWTSELTRTSTGGLTLPTGPYLPCDPQTAAQFDAVLMSFTELSTLILRTLHIDLRLQLLQGIYKAMDTTYALNQPYNDPDPAILALSTNLSTYDAVLSTHVLTPQYAFLTANLDVLINNSLTSLATTIPAMDLHGNARMSLNILVLQQSLKSLQPSADLNKAARFYELGAQGPEAVVKDGPKEGFAIADLKALVRLCWNEERDKELGGVEQMAGKLGGFPERKASLKGRSRSRQGGRSPRTE